MKNNLTPLTKDEELKVDILDLFDPKVPYPHAIRVLEKYVQQAIKQERSRIADIVEECVEFQRRKDPDTIMINKIDLLEALENNES